MLKAPELWGGSSEAKANFGSAALFLTQVNDLAVLLLTVGNISQDNPFVQYDGLFVGVREIGRKGFGGKCLEP